MLFFSFKRFIRGNVVIFLFTLLGSSSLQSRSSENNKTRINFLLYIRTWNVINKNGVFKAERIQARFPGSD